jgi:hypothetical protein
MSKTAPPPSGFGDWEPPQRLQRRGRTESWRTGIENQAARLQLVLDGVVQEEMQELASRLGPNQSLAEEAPRLGPVMQRIQNDLTLALEITEGGKASQGLLGRLRELWTGSGFEQALAAVNRASEMLLLVQPGPAVLARLPDLRAGVKDHLRVTDPRFDGYMRIIDAAERRAGLLPPQEPRPQGRGDHESQERNAAPDDTRGG